MYKYTKLLNIKLSERIIDKKKSYKKIMHKIYYDPVEGINKIKIGVKCVPAVLLDNFLGTETVTKAYGEATDQDYNGVPLLSMGTRTITEVRAESTDSDISNFLSIGTRTKTADRIENTDEDISHFY